MYGVVSTVAPAHLFRNVWAILYMVDSSLLSQAIVKISVPAAWHLFRRGHPSEVQPVIILLRLTGEVMRKGNAYVHEYLRWQSAV